MAISVDTVYQRVLAMANKEQRGYITPQEFNLLANQAQIEIFESYFYDKNQRERLEPEDTYTEVSISKLLERKLSPFTTIGSVVGGHTYPSHYQIGKIFLDDLVCVKMDRNELMRYKKSSRHSSMNINNFDAVYIDTRLDGKDIEVYRMDGSATQETGGVSCEVINAPATVEWAYVVVNEKALYNGNLAVDFELHSSEETELVYKILKFAGISIVRQDLSGAASSMEMSQIQQEKQ